MKSQSMKKLLCNLPRFVLWIAFLLIIESYVTLQAQTSSSNNSSKAISGKIVDETDLPIAGATVQVIRGQLQGLVAELVECQGNNKLLLRIEGLGCALATVSADCVVSKEKQ